MSFIRKEINAALYAFTHWIMPPAVRRYKYPKPGSRLYRYPSIGSEPVDYENSYIDYKTAYRDSTHHIRNNVDTQKTLQTYLYIQDPIGETANEKLVRYGFLEADQINNTGAVEQARTDYEAQIGESVDVRNHQDDFGFSELGIGRDNREAVAEYITSVFEGLKQGNAHEAWQNNLDEIYNTDFYVLRNFDYAADDPVYRQMEMDMRKQLDDIAQNRLDIKEFPVFRSNAATWAILDDSFSAENIKKVQSSVKNFTGYEDLSPVIYGEGEIPPSKGGPGIAVPHVSKHYEQ